MEKDKKERLKEEQEKLMIQLIIEDLVRETEEERLSESHSDKPLRSVEDEKTIAKIVKDKINSSEVKAWNLRFPQIVERRNEQLFWIFFWIIIGFIAIVLSSYFGAR